MNAIETLVIGLSYATATRTKAKRCFGMVALSIFLLHLGILPAMASDKAASGKSFTYAVKFTCVNEVGPAANGDEVPFVPAVYRTVVNVHNPHDQTVTFTKKAVLARSQDLPRGPITIREIEDLAPHQALAVDCIDIQKNLFGGLQPIGDGFLVIESSVELNVVAVYTTLSIVEKQKILFRFVSDPFKVRVLKEHDADREELPSPGPPPSPPALNMLGLGVYPEVLSVDFEKVFELENKIIYNFAEPPGVPGCPPEGCSGTREVLIPAPETGIVFPVGRFPNENFRSLEDVVRDLDPSFVRIIDIDSALRQENKIKQEVTYRWVSEPRELVVSFPNTGFFNPLEMVEDDDQDGQRNEDPIDLINNDGDNEHDEDPPPPAGFRIEILDVELTVGVGESEDIEYIQPHKGKWHLIKRDPGD